MAESERVLVLCANRVSGPPSGLPVHLLDLAATLPDVLFGFLCVEDDLLRLDVVHREAGREEAYAWPISEEGCVSLSEDERSPFRDSAVDRSILECGFAIVQPSVIHIHHLLGHSRAIYSLAEEYGLGVIHTLHDYYSMHPDIHIPAHSDSKVSSSAANIEDWCRNMQELLKAANVVTVPSASVLENMKPHLELSQGRCVVVPLGLPASVLAQRVKRTARATTGLLRVGVLGTLKLDRSWLKVLEWAPKKLEVHYFGHVPLTYDPAPGHQTTFHGPYARDQIVPILAKEELDLVIIPSMYKETFSIALSEAWCAGVPVLAPNSGAFAERMAEGGGWLYDPRDPSLAGVKLVELEAKQDLIEGEMKKVAAAPLMEMVETAATYRSLWSKVAQGESQGRGDCLIESAKRSS